MAEKNETVKQTSAGGGHNVLVLDRKIMNLTGIEDVVSFDESGAVLKTSIGTLAVDGEELHVVKLDLSGGNVSIEGKINGLFYSETGGGRSKAKRLFR